MQLSPGTVRLLENATAGAVTGGMAGAATAPDSMSSGALRGALGGALSGAAAGHIAGPRSIQPEVAAALSGLGSGGVMGLLPEKTGSIEYHGHTFPGYNKPIVNKDGGKHKMKVLAKKGDKVKMIGFGHRDYGHNYSAKAKANYLKRSAGIKDKSGKPTKDDKLSANYWARRILWPKGPATGAAKKEASYGTSLADILYERIVKTANLGSQMEHALDSAILSGALGAGGGALFAEPEDREAAALRGGTIGSVAGGLMGIKSPATMNSLLTNTGIGASLGAAGAKVLEPTGLSQHLTVPQSSSSEYENAARQMGYASDADYVHNYYKNYYSNPEQFAVQHPNGSIDFYQNGELVGSQKTANILSTLASGARTAGGALASGARTAGGAVMRGMAAPVRNFATGAAAGALIGGAGAAANNGNVLGAMGRGAVLGGAGGLVGGAMFPRAARGAVRAGGTRALPASTTSSGPMLALPANAGPSGMGSVRTASLRSKQAAVYPINSTLAEHLAEGLVYGALPGAVAGGVVSDDDTRLRNMLLGAALGTGLGTAHSYMSPPVALTVPDYTAGRALVARNPGSETLSEVLKRRPKSGGR